MNKCKCGLNPNDSQSKEQQKWEAEYIKVNGLCSACINDDVAIDERNDDSGIDDGRIKDYYDK